MKRNIIGLDLGTNSIGWAMVTIDEEGKHSPVIKLGSRIIPMSQDVLGKFNAGVTESQTSLRTGFRSVRRLRERELLRRERLFRILHAMDALPEHFDSAIGWDKKETKTFAKFIDNKEPKLAWRPAKNGGMEFLFKNSFDEMLADFADHHPEYVAAGKKVPMDWTIYYLRKKALTSPISKQELAWILLNFNQKRGYYQLRGEDEEQDKTKIDEYCVLKVASVNPTEDRKGDNIWYEVHLENGWIYRRASKVSLDDWIGKEKEFIVTTELDKDGNLKKDDDGNIKRSFRAPQEGDWTLVKKRTEKQICDSKETVGTFIYDILLTSPEKKVRGNLVRTIERKFYKDELQAILEKQKEFIPELSDPQVLERCVSELYPNNEPYRSSLLARDMTNLLINDTIFYQRPLKSKKSLIDDCPYESYSYVDKETGEVKTQTIKCIAKSNPYFQEFRLWQFIQNLKLFDTDNLDKDITSDYLPDCEAVARLFDFLDDKKEIKEETILKYFGIKKQGTGYKIRWNYVQDKIYPGNETKHIIVSSLKKAGAQLDINADEATYYRLWHLLYSVEDKNEIKRALQSFAEAYGLNDDFVKVFSAIPSFKKEYGSYSEKAIKKLLSLMRKGHHWNADSIPESVKKRIEIIASGNIDDKLKEKIHYSPEKYSSAESFRGLPLWEACYVVYGRHSEAECVTKWNTPAEMMGYIKGFKQHSLRNPIVEQCILESLRTVHDIWVECGHIDEIHIELGREMKLPNDARSKMTAKILENENTNLRIKSLLLELKNDGVESVRPYSPMQQEILKIYEEGALNELKKDDKDFKEISRISKLSQPTHAELTRYKLWLEQKYMSPYTGRMIPLSKLFTSAYQIEHVIPQKRYFDDSIRNKVICESKVNELKSSMLGHEFISKYGGQTVDTVFGGSVKIFNVTEYEKFVKGHYSSNPSKMKNLLYDDIPEQFINRQMNDSRYISRAVMSILSNIVREEDEQESISKNVIPCVGSVTDRLKKDWGLNDIWNDMVYPRFERMNYLTGTSLFGQWENKGGKRVFQTQMPIELSKGFTKKRIDHRHHAMDALTIACATRNIINYLSNQNAADTTKREDLRVLLCTKDKMIKKPWDTFTQDAYAALLGVVVSFKNNVRVINKSTNKYEHYDESGKKVKMTQHGASQWAIRKPLHKDTIYGRVNLRLKKTVSIASALDDVNSIVDKDIRLEIINMFSHGLDKKSIVKNIKDNGGRLKGKDALKVEVYYFTDDTNEPQVACRKPLDASFDEKKIRSSITDTGVQKILLNYLMAKGGKADIAFTPEGIEEMNANIAIYNDGRSHQPIRRVRCYEPMGEKFQVGEVGTKSSKYVEAQKGTNLFFAIYESPEGKRSYKTVPLSEVIERQKIGLSPVRDTDEYGNILKFTLSPNELVYVPTEEEMASPTDVKFLSINRIYKFVSSSKFQAFFVPHLFASSIFNAKNDLSKELKCDNVVNEISVGNALAKSERTISLAQSPEESLLMIKSVCWKLEVDRLGNITRIIK